MEELHRAMLGMVVLNAELSCPLLMESGHITLTNQKKEKTIWNTINLTLLINA
jgi:hypothetical protein